MIRTLLRLSVAAALLAVAGAASAQSTANIPVSATVNKTCTITAPASIDFGAYDPVATPNPTVTTNISVVCTKGTSWSVDLSDGLYKATAATTTRAMSDGATPTTHYLAYELYTSDHTTAWYTGAASGQAGVSSGKAASSTLELFARIEDADPNYGTYADTVTATIVF